MTKFGARLLTQTIKNPQKRHFVYNFLIDNTFANNVLKQKNIAEKQLHYIHNYLAKPKLAIVWIVGGLGNQMYLYAFGKALQSKGYSVIFDAGHYKNLSNGGGQKL